MRKTQLDELQGPDELQGLKRVRSRKIPLDPEIYCPHSMRESDGDADCDHDFEDQPDVAQPAFAIWTCTICGRAVRFDVWQ